MGSKKSPTDKEEELSPELEWIRFRETTLGPAAYGEPAGAKFGRKIKENLLVPVGAMATFGALSYGLWCFGQGRSRDSQIMMRARIGAQAFTVVAILGGISFGVSSNQSTNTPNIGVNAEPFPAKS